MSKPRAENPWPELPGQIKTVFYNEGNPVALLVRNLAGRRRQSTMDFPTAEAALGWCRQNGAILVYCPVALEAN